LGNLIKNFFAVWNNSHFLPIYYTYARAKIRSALPVDLRRLTAAWTDEAVLALTGDITAWPDDPEGILNEYYKYVRELEQALPSGSKLLPILGNHDWGPALKFRAPRETNFLRTNFETEYEITKPRVFYWPVTGFYVVFFLIESSQKMLPAAGEVDDATFTFLRDAFEAGRRSKLGPADLDYERAVKVLMLHHSPLHQIAYDGPLPPGRHWGLRLKNSDRLFRACGNDIDMFLFGHTHTPMPIAAEGFVMIDGGTTLAEAPSVKLPSPGFQVIDIVDRDTIRVESYSWFQTAFVTAGSRSFRRGADTRSGIGTGRWG
jgi:hypothetical protein